MFKSLRSCAPPCDLAALSLLCAFRPGGSHWTVRFLFRLIVRLLARLQAQFSLLPRVYRFSFRCCLAFTGRSNQVVCYVSVALRLRLPLLAASLVLWVGRSPQIVRLTRSTNWLKRRDVFGQPRRLHSWCRSKSMSTSRTVEVWEEPVSLRLPTCFCALVVFAVPRRI